MAISNYTTKIDPHKTIGEITQILAKHGARETAITYDTDGIPVAVRFMLILSNKPLYFELPARANGVLEALRKDKVPKGLLTMEHANRVAWRIIRDWVEAQTALIKAEIAQPQEIFLPYLILKDGQTLFNKIKDDGTKLIEM